ncbi:hypothetical protein BJ944DRAFT_273382 [Cunninghamella echinulata]|nr:hypothetical protein BJ944DRAFT_273382 [Cunninghamella echinulata]
MTLYDLLLLTLTNHTIDELGLLPCIPDKNEIPPATQHYYPLFVYESKLGISLDSIVILLKEAQQRFLYYQQPQQCDNLIQLEQASRILIMLKPDHYTSMNTRKKLIQFGHIKVKDELELIDLIFTIPRNTKSSIAWHHRKWLIQRQYKNIKNLDIEKEIKICERCIQLHPRNYYAWEYRYWLISTFLKQDIQKIIKEYQAMCQWIENNVSDHSGISYMEQLLKLLTTLLIKNNEEKEEENDKLNLETIMHSHLIWLDQLVLSYEGHETLWCHKRCCTSLWIDLHNPSSAALLSSWFIQQHESIKQLLFELNPSHHHLISLSKQQEQQFTFASKYGLWLCLMEKRQQQINPIEQTKANDLVDFYLQALQLYDSTPIYSSWKLFLQ